MPLDPDQPPKHFRDALYTVDKSGRRTYVFADIAGGVWRRRRVFFSALLIVFYVALPFIEVNGGPLLRIDLAERRYTVAGFTFWPQDLMYALLFGLVAVVGTLLLVALFGRIFCGWLCPHNVFLEMVYRPIEQWLEGRGHRRAIIHRRGANGGQRLRKIVKWAIYLIITGALANTATALFVGTDAFIGGIIIDPFKHPTAAIVFVIFMVANLFNFGWFRELTCTFVCPYGRMQAAMLDQHTLGVAYDPNRGEPRGKPGAKAGDCVDCVRCVQVCPTGIDIRNGNQLECIHCTACIDACDVVMDKLHRPRGLIRYTSDIQLAGGQRQVLRPRTVFYAALLLLLLSILGGLLYSRTDVQFIRLRDQATTERSLAADGTPIMSKLLSYEVFNRAAEAMPLQITVDDPPGAVLVGRDHELTLASGERRQLSFFLQLPVESAAKQAVIRVRYPTGESVDSVQLKYGQQVYAGLH